MAQSHPSISTPPSETNLKVKQALTVTGELGDNVDALAHFKGETSTNQQTIKPKVSSFTITYEKRGRKSCFFKYFSFKSNLHFDFLT